ncbi:MAG: hypothetical protein OHK0023_13760 [Anaerolineae bacterium]
MNRRAFLKTVSMGSAAAAAALSAPNLMRALAREDFPEPLRAPANIEARTPAAHLLNRISFGAQVGDVEAVSRMGIEAYIQSQLNPTDLDDSAAEARLADLITLDMTPQEMLAAGFQPGQIVSQLIQATITRSVYSTRQLYEVMVNFWSEHFSIYHRKGVCTILKTGDDRDVVRANALSNFRDLLHASAKSPAMLFYLDNAGSNKQHPNENYARELMELHTITVGNYTEEDVKEVARAFTGWSIRGRRGEFIFNQRIHDNGEKRTLGLVIPANGGIRDGEIILDHLATHPSTAKHIASKLVRRFISDDPPQPVVDAVAAEFLRTGGDVRAMLNVIFASPEFWSAPPKFKRPYEFLIGTLRAFNANPRANVYRLIGLALRNMGHLPFDWPSPDGYSDYAKDWIGNMLSRWNWIIQLMNEGRRFGVDPIRLAQQQGQRTWDAMLTFYANHLLGRTLTDAENSTILDYAQKIGTPNLLTADGRAVILEMIALIAASPAYMYR